MSTLMSLSVGARTSSPDSYSPSSTSSVMHQLFKNVFGHFLPSIMLGPERCNVNQSFVATRHTFHDTFGGIRFVLVRFISLFRYINLHIFGFVCIRFNRN